VSTFRCIFAVLTIAIANLSYAWAPFGPKTYEDCVLDGMKGVQSDAAANATITACALKFQTQGNSSQNPKKSNMVRCGSEDVDRTEHARAEFPNPNDFGSLKIIRLAWEEPHNYSAPKVFRVYVQHSFPFDIEGFYLQGYKPDGSEDASYFCRGHIGANAVGYGTCSNIQESSKKFSVKSIVTPEMSTLALMKKLKKC
jgi:hypothetical protein